MTATPPESPLLLPARPAFFVRAARALVIAALGLSLSFLLLLSVLAGAVFLQERIKSMFSEGHLEGGLVMSLILIAVLILPIAILVFCNRRGWLRWPQLTALGVFVALCFTYLSWDDPTVRRPLSMDQLSPALPGDDATFQIFLRYAKNTPATNAVKPLAKLQVGAAGNNIVTAPAQWIAFLREHRAEIETEWAQLAPVRAWWDELAAPPRIGDLTLRSESAPIIAFQPMRIYAQLAVAIASLQAIDGHGDAAFATLERLHNVVRKFEPNSRTLVRSMIAKVIQKMALQTAGFVLDHATVSPAARAAFVRELTAATTGPAGASHLVLMEYAYFQAALIHFTSGTETASDDRSRNLQRVLRAFGGLIVNPRATQNLVGDHYYSLAALAEARDFNKIEATEGPFNRELELGYRVKNLGGRLFATMAVPVLSKVIRSYWDTEDLRSALIKRLQA